MSSRSSTATTTGVGDFRGLTLKLDYLQGLGITCVWLLPFFPSPLRDDGYDIADYLNIHHSTLPRRLHRVRAGGARWQIGCHRAGPSTTPRTSTRGSSARGRPKGSRAQVLRLERHRAEVPETRIIFCDTENRTGPMTPWPASTLAPLLLAPTGSQPQQSGRRRRRHRRDEVLVRPGGRCAAVGRGSLFVPCGTGRATRICPRPTRSFSVCAKALDRNVPQSHAPRGSQPVALGCAPLFGDGNECHMAFHFR